MNGWRTAFAVLLLAWVLPAAADQDGNLDLIPAPATAVAAPAADTGQGQKIYVEDAVTTVSRSDHPAVPPPSQGYLWQERLLLDVRADRALSEGFELHLSDRLNLRDEDDLPFPTHEDVINDLRENYLGWRPSNSSYLDAGRINLKSGIALGYNPTDFFKTRSVTEPLSNDPSAQREDRLGTVMLRGQDIWEGGSLTLAYAPKISHPTPIYSNDDLPSFNPMYDRTNADDRFLVKTSLDLGDDSSPEFLLYREAGETHLGTDLSVGLGQHAVGYLEWSGARRADLITEAMDYGRETGSLPADAISPLPTGTNRTFKSEMALGASYTNEYNMTFNAEYLVNQAGFSGRDWDNWFAVAAHAAQGSPVVDELWYLRAYAQDQQQLNTRQAYFARMDWVDAFSLKLELTAFTLVDGHDGSGIAQISADYYLSDHWTLGGQVVKYFGSRRSDFGSLGTSYSLLLNATHYF